MNGKMTLLTLKATGHVLGALTRTGSPDGTLTAEDVAGALAVRDATSGAVLHHVPAALLSVVPVDRNDDLLFQPSSYAVVNGAAQLLAPASGLTVKLTLTSLEVEGSQATLPVGTNVWAQIGDQPPMVAAAIAASSTGKSTVTFNLALQSDTHHLLVLATGYRAYRETKAL